MTEPFPLADRSFLPVPAYLNAAFEKVGLTGLGILTLVAANAEPKGYRHRVAMSIRQIAEATGLPRMTIQRAIRKIVQAGLLIEIEGDLLFPLGSNGFLRTPSKPAASDGTPVSPWNNTNNNGTFEDFGTPRNGGFGTPASLCNHKGNNGNSEASGTPDFQPQPAGSDANAAWDTEFAKNGTPPTRWKQRDFPGFSEPFGTAKTEKVGHPEGKEPLRKRNGTDFGTPASLCNHGENNGNSEAFGTLFGTPATLLQPYSYMGETKMYGVGSILTVHSDTQSDSCNELEKFGTDGGNNTPAANPEPEPVDPDDYPFIGKTYRLNRRDYLQWRIELAPHVTAEGRLEEVLRSYDDQIETEMLAHPKRKHNPFMRARMLLIYEERFAAKRAKQFGPSKFVI